MSTRENIRLIARTSLVRLKGVILAMRVLVSEFYYIRQNTNIPVLRVTPPYLNPLVKFRFSGGKYNFIHFERQNAFQNA